MPTKSHSERGQPVSFLAENLLHRSILLHFHVEHRPRTQHRNPGSLSKRTIDYRRRGQQLEKLSHLGERWNFMSQDEYDQLPVAPRLKC